MTTNTLLPTKLTTERLSITGFVVADYREVAHLDYPSDPGDIMFFARNRDEPNGDIIAFMSVSASNRRIGAHYVLWLETKPRFRRRGIALELFRAVEKHLGGAGLIYDSSTPEGLAFIAHIDGWPPETLEAGLKALEAEHAELQRLRAEMGTLA